MFPPKKSDAFENAKETMKELAALSPDFISVTYGAGGGTSQNTIKIASYIENELGTSALAHLSCVSSSRQEISKLIDEMKEAKNRKRPGSQRRQFQKTECFRKPDIINTHISLLKSLKREADSVSELPVIPKDTWSVKARAVTLTI